jgi:hypothetical protein
LPSPFFLSCTASFDLPSNATSLPLYWSSHQLEQQHFPSAESDQERSLRAQIKSADVELKRLQHQKHEIDNHIQVLHQYNEIKDVVQALMGKCAEMEGRTTKGELRSHHVASTCSCLVSIDCSPPGPPCLSHS